MAFHIAHLVDGLARGHESRVRNWPRRTVPKPGTDKTKSEGRGGFIDRLLESTWKKAGVNPAKPVTDEEYLRRAYLDLLGRIPIVQEARAFLQTKETDKREKLVDSCSITRTIPRTSRPNGRFC